MAKEETITDVEEQLALATIKPDDLGHLNDLSAVIEGYKKDYGALTIADETDKEGYEKVRKALGVMRPHRTSIEAERKSKTAPYADTIKYINSRYKQITEAIAEIEAPLKDRKSEIDDIEEKRKKQEEIDRETKLNERVGALIKNGAAFDGSYYSIKDESLNISEISLGVVDVRSMSDELFKNFLQQVIDKNAMILSERERVQKEKEESEKLQKQQEEEARQKLAAEQETLRLEREQFQKERDEMNAERERISAEKKAEEDRKEAEVKQLLEAKLEDRKNQLFGLGMKYDGKLSAYVYDGINENIDLFTEVVKFDEAQWNDVIARITDKIKEAKQEKEKQLIEDRKAEEERIAKKAIADKEAEDKRLEEDRKLLLAAQSDKKKWDDYVLRLKSVEPPVLSVPRYTTKLKNVLDVIQYL